MIGIFGGTFDPIHYGHLRCAWEIAEQLELTEVRMVPSYQPPHRNQPLAAPEHRKRMLELALIGQHPLRLDCRELERGGLSYSVDTLNSFRSELGDEPLCLILGQDAFNAFDSWHRWTEVSELAHIVVITRPGAELPKQGPVADLIDRRGVEAVDELCARPAGSILFRTVTALAFSATSIRNLLATGRSPRYLLPDKVLDYILQQGLYGQLD